MYNKQHSNLIDVRVFREADCDSDHCLVVSDIM